MQVEVDVGGRPGNEHCPRFGPDFELRRLEARRARETSAHTRRITSASLSLVLPLCTDQNASKGPPLLFLNTLDCCFFNHIYAVKIVQRRVDNILGHQVRALIIASTADQPRAGPVGSASGLPTQRQRILCDRPLIGTDQLRTSLQMHCSRIVKALAA